MRSQEARYVLTDVISTSRIVLSFGHKLETILFIQQNIVDSRVIIVPVKIWRKWRIRVKTAPQGTFFLIRDNELFFARDEDISDVTKQKVERAKLLADGYSKLVWYANQLTELCWSTSSISYSDLLFLLLGGPKLTSFYATSKGIPIDQAVKQIEIDKQSLSIGP